VRNSLTRITAG